MKDNQKFFDQCFTDGGRLETLKDLQHLAMNYPHPEHSTAPDPLFHALLYYVEEIKSAAFLVYDKCRLELLRYPHSAC
jgi:hypothetical protein